MFAHLLPAVPNDPGQQAEDQRAEDAQLYRHVLHELMTIGIDLARLLHQDAINHAMQQAKATYPEPLATTDMTVAYDRTSRAVRRCIALARSLGDPAQPARTPATRHTAARGCPLDEAGHAPHDGDSEATSGDEGADAEPFRADLRDRPDAPDLDDGITGRPLPDVIASICCDLGLAAPPGPQPWTPGAPEDAREDARKDAGNDTGQVRARTAAPSRAWQQGTEPHGPGQGAKRHPTGPQPDQQAPSETAATPGADPGPLHPCPALPDNPPETLATIPSQAVRAQWRPPPGT